MNLRTAALLLNKNLVALNCAFQNDIEKRISREYTYVADQTWLGELEPGAKLIAQTANQKDVCIVVFMSWADLADLDLDEDSGIIYKFILGPVPSEYFSRLNAGEDGIKATIKNMKKLRITKIRETIEQQLLAAPEL
jgi:hypothetical protein